MLQYLSNAFNDPSDPWYYVIGVLFLLLIFGAIAVYVILSNKKNKNGADKKDNTADSTTDTAQTADEKPEAENVDTVNAPQEPSDK